MYKLISQFPVLSIVFIVFIGIIESTIITTILKYCQDTHIIIQILLCLVAFATIWGAYLVTYKTFEKASAKLNGKSK